MDVADYMLCSPAVLIASGTTRLAKDRSRRRHHGRRSRAHDGDAALSKHRAHPFRSVQRQERPVRQSADLRRARDFAGARPHINGLANAFHVAAINGGRHVAPLFAGGTVFAWLEFRRKPNCRDAMTSACCGCARSPARTARAQISAKAGEEDDPAVLLDLDYGALIPLSRRLAMHRATPRAPGASPCEARYFDTPPAVPWLPVCRPPLPIPAPLPMPEPPPMPTGGLHGRLSPIGPLMGEPEPCTCRPWPLP